jgi:hypothetical protein
MNDSFPSLLFVVLVVALVVIAVSKSCEQKVAAVPPAPAAAIEQPLVLTMEECRKFLVAAANDRDNENVLVWNACLGIQALDWCELPVDAQRALRRHGAAGRICPEDIAREAKCNPLQINPETDNNLSPAELQKKSRAWADCMGFESIEWCELDPASRKALQDMGAQGRTCI